MAQYEITLRDYWRILRRRKSIVVFTALLLGGFSFSAAYFWKPQPLYKATASVQINSSQTFAGLYLETMTYSVGDQIETQQAIVSSFPVLKRVGKELDMFTGADTAQVILDLQGRIDTQQEGYTNIIVIEVTDGDPRKARDLTNTVARMYQEYNHEQKNQQAVNHRRFVGEQRDKAREALAEAEDMVRLYREETDLVSLDAQASIMLGQITQGEQEMTRLGQTAGDIDVMLEEMEREGGLSGKTMQGATKVQVGEAFMNLTYQLNNMRLERDGLLVQFTENHPRVAQLQAKIDQLSTNLTDELRKRRQSVVRDLEGGETRLATLHQGYNQLPSRGLKLARLEREVALRQEVVSVLEEEYQTALIREADKVEEVAILQEAVVPTQPVNPTEPLQRAVIGIVLGIVLGVVFAVIAETLDTSIGTIEDVQEYTGTQVVGVIPFIQLDEVEESLRRSGQVDLDRRTLERKAQLVAYFDPKSTLAETFRTLRTNIEFVTVEKGIRSLMVTSSTSQEGKSTIGANLAMTMAQLGKRVLYVDCDLRRPAVFRMFGLDKDPGLTEVIVGNYQWGDVVRTVTDIVTGGMGMEDIMQTQGISNLHIITSGAIPPNPAELLNSRRMNDFLDAVSQAYDVVLLDAPPVLHVTDAAILGKKVDGALMVYKAGDVPRTSLRRAVNLLRSVEVELLGMVINGIRADISTDYHDFGYSSYYAYGKDDGRESRTLAGRFKGLVDRWRKGDDGSGPDPFGEEPDYEDRDLDDEIEDLDPERDSGFEDVAAGPSHAESRSARAASFGLLGLVALGFVWQSGYLARPLGLIPVFAGHRVVEEEGAVEKVPDEVNSTSVSAEVDAVTVPEYDLAEPVQEEAFPVDSDPGEGGAGAAQFRAQEQIVAESSQVSEPLAATAESASPFRVKAPKWAEEIQVSDPLEPVDELSSESAPAAQVQSATPDRPYAIRIAAYVANSSWGQRLLERLRERGEVAFLVPVSVGQQRLVRLLVGSFTSWDRAFEHARRLEAQGVFDAFEIARMPYAVELEAPTDSARVEGILAQLGERGRFAYAQDGPGRSIRLLAGAFETREAAQFFADEWADAEVPMRIVSR